MNSFISTYECKMDDKARLKVPISLAKQVEGSAETSFVLKRSVFQNCLEIYPLKNWEVVMNKLNNLNSFVKKNIDFKRIYTAGVKCVELDKVGRIQIPKDLVNFAQLEKDIVLAGVGNYLEVWNKDAYEKAIEISEEDFAQLTEEVMKDI